MCLIVIAITIASFSFSREGHGAKTIEPIVSGESKRCVKCHKKISAAIVKQWEHSTHAKTGVGRYECHRSDKDDEGAWHHEGRRARRGASMMGPSYTHWYGMYKVGKNYYFEFLPEVVKSSG